MVSVLARWKGPRESRAVFATFAILAPACARERVVEPLSHPSRRGARIPGVARD